MQDQETLELVGRRNTIAFEQALRDVRADVSKLAEAVRLLTESAGALVGRMAELERVNLLQKAQSTGHGPSVRS